MQKNVKKDLIKELETLWKEACVYIWGDICEVCGRPANTFHHFIPRGKSLILRYDILNGIPLCQSCHSKIHHITKNPDDVYEIQKKIRNQRGKLWENYIDTRKKVKNGSYTIKLLQEQADYLKEIIAR